MKINTNVKESMDKQTRFKKANPELTARLKKKYPNIGFLFALANDKKNIDYIKKQKK